VSSPLPSVENAAPPGRYLIAAGTARYEFLDEKDWLLEVEDAVRLVTELFTKKLGYKRVLPDLGDSPTVEQLRKGISHWLTSAERRAFDLVVIYYAGHGHSQGHEHYLLAADSRYEELGGTALKSGVLAEVLSQARVQQILLILDTCFAGHGAEDFAATAGRVSRIQPWDHCLPSGVYAIAAAGPKEGAAKCRFTQELVRVIGEPPPDWDVRNLQFLDLASVVGEINRRFHGKVPQTVKLYAAGVDRELQFFPNLGYLQVPPGVDSLELNTHWGPRSRSVKDAAQKGSYFTGRVAALSELVAWLKAPAAVGGGARVITGKAGSGKSAVLSRLVTLSLPDYRNKWRVSLGAIPLETIPPPIDAAVLAQYKLLTECVEAIARAVAVKADQPEALLDALAEWVGGRTDDRLRVILFDGLDECLDRFDVARRLLRPLAEARSVRLLVAVRREALPGRSSDLFDALGPAFEVLDLDDPRYAPQEDFAAYATRRLLHETDMEHPNPYRGRADLARQVGQAVGRRACPVFLVAQLMCETLVKADEAVDVTRPGWDAKFPETVNAAFEDYLNCFEPYKSKVVDLLRPLAYAEGAGLPLDLWPSLASALAPPADTPPAYTADDVQWLLGRAGAFIVEAVEDGRSVYRLDHKALAEYLRSPEQAVSHQEQIARTLTGLTPDHPDGGKDWPRAKPYARNYLAVHARPAGMLGKLVSQPLYVVAAEPDRLLHELISDRRNLPRELVNVLHVYQSVIHHLRNASLEERTSYLVMVARQSGFDAFANQIERLALPRAFSVPWAKWQFAATHRVLSGHEGDVKTIAVATIDDYAVVVSGGDDRTVRIWDLVSGRPFCQPLRGHEKGIKFVAVTKIKDKAVVVSADDGGTVRIWDLDSGQSIGQPLRARELIGDYGSLAVGTLKLDAVAIFGGHDGVLRIWDLASGQLRGHPLQCHDAGTWPMEVGVIDGLDVIASGGVDGTVRLWNLASGEPVGQPLTRSNYLGVRWFLRQAGRVLEGFTCHPGWVNWAGFVSGAVKILNGKTVAIFGSDHGTVWVWVWDLASGQSAGQELVGHDGSVPAVTAGAVKDSAVIISGGRDGTVRVWDLASGQPVSQPLRGHEGSVSSVAMGMIDDYHSVIVSGGGDGTVRVWDLGSGQPFVQPPLEVKTSRLGVRMKGQRVVYEGRHPDDGLGVLSVAVGALDHQLVTVSGRVDGTVWVRDLVSGRPVSQPWWGHDFVPLGVDSLGRVYSKIKWQDDEYMLKPWAVRTGADRPRAALTVAVGVVDRTAVIVSGGSDGTVRVWNLASGDEVGPPLRGHEGAVRSVAVGARDHHPVVISGSDDGTVRVWDLVSRQPIGQPLHHPESVRSVATAAIRDNKVVVSGGDDGMVRVWDLTSRRLVREPLRGHCISVCSVAVGALDGLDVIASGGGDGTVRLWNVASGEPVGQPLLGHEGPVWSVALGTIDGLSVIVSGGRDGTVRLWRGTGEVMMIVHVDAMVYSIALAPRAQIVVGATKGLMALQCNLDARFVERAADFERASPDPGDLRQWQSSVGAELLFRVTGRTTGVVYGSDVYTSDSNLATAAVHAGVLAPDQTDVVRVCIVPVLPRYEGSARNGVTTRPWATSWTGAFRVERAGGPPGDDSRIPRDRAVHTRTRGLFLDHPSNNQVGLEAASLAPPTLHVEIGVRNLAYTKVVGIVFTTDNWATEQTAYGIYDSTVWSKTSDFEMWKVAPTVGSATEVRFAIFYRVAGSEYWDNNFGRNYRVTPSNPQRWSDAP
jgi:WD40 repeat protein